MNKLSPTEIASGSLKKYWWKCQKCKNEWKAQVNSRAGRSSGCPVCNESKGERLVSQILDKLNVRYKREYKFSELGHKRFDFALFKKYKRKPYAIIEYHGKQHYEVVNFSKNKQKNIDKFKRTIKNDEIKKQFISSLNIKYLEIPYFWDENKILNNINLIIF